MAIYLIRHRWTRHELAAVEAPTHARALEWAVRQGLNLIEVDLAGVSLRAAFLAGADLRGAALSDAELSGCYLRGADLRGADLRGTRLAHAFLGGADLRQADLREADLSRADLRGTSLVGADLRGTILTGARLAGTRFDWRWSVVPAELLRQHHSSSAEGSRLVVDMAFHDDPRPWSWLKLMVDLRTGADWAFGVLANSVLEGDNAPDLLRLLAADTARTREKMTEMFNAPARRIADTVGQRYDEAVGPVPHPPMSADSLSGPRMMWTSRRGPEVGVTRDIPAP
jgi:uncharacterized protein YjbI with pentapeptide repeats